MSKYNLGPGYKPKKTNYLDAHYQYVTEAAKAQESSNLFHQDAAAYRGQHALALMQHAEKYKPITEAIAKGKETLHPLNVTEESQTDLVPQSAAATAPAKPIVANPLEEEIRMLLQAQDDRLFGLNKVDEVAPGVPCYTFGFLYVHDYIIVLGPKISVLLKNTETVTEFPYSFDLMKLL